MALFISFKCSIYMCVYFDKSQRKHLQAHSIRIIKLLHILFKKIAVKH
jgi:hypothetical protein